MAQKTKLKKSGESTPDSRGLFLVAPSGQSEDRDPIIRMTAPKVKGAGIRMVSLHGHLTEPIATQGSGLVERLTHAIRAFRVY
jgi:hypothetical protein